jgi:beta-glucosidase
MERLDDAVRRILRVKLASGIFEKGLPSSRVNAGDVSKLALPENRKIARQAVRESMVLLKNNNQTLPIDPSKNILVIGDGAQRITKATGGWTLSWQGNNHSNDEFPNATSIIDGIEEIVNKSGGKMFFSENGDFSNDVDVVVAVYGEDPYAEFQGDRENLDFISNEFDTKILENYKDQGVPVVSVFLSGRPMWTNPEMNNSDSFIAAWLPGSEGGGVADLLFRVDPTYDFTGRLSFSWPSKASVSENNEKLFELGYGLSYDSNLIVDSLLEDSGLEDSGLASTGQFYSKGAVVPPWKLWLISGDLEKQIASFPTSVGGLIISKTDHLAQEDALRINWTMGEETRYSPSDDGDYFRISTEQPDNMTRQSNGAMKLAFNAKSLSGPNEVIRIGQCDITLNCNKTLEIEIDNEWTEYLISLKDFENLGIDMSSITSSILIKAKPGVDIGISNIRLE